MDVSYFVCAHGFIDSPTVTRGELNFRLALERITPRTRLHNAKTPIEATAAQFEPYDPLERAEQRLRCVARVYRRSTGQLNNDSSLQPPGLQSAGHDDHQRHIPAPVAQVHSASPYVPRSAASRASCSSVPCTRAATRGSPQTPADALTLFDFEETLSTKSARPLDLMQPASTAT